MSETYKGPEQIKFPNIDLLIKKYCYETNILKYTDTGIPSVILVKFENGQSFVLKCQTDDIHCNIKYEIRAMESLYKYISIPKGQLQDIEEGIITTNKNNETISINGNFLVMEAISQEDFIPAEMFLKQGHDPENLARAVDNYFRDLFIMYEKTCSIIHTTNSYQWERNFTNNFWSKYIIDTSKEIIIKGKIYSSLQTNNFQIQERLNYSKLAICAKIHGDSGLQNIFAEINNYKAGHNYVAIDPKNKIVDVTDDLSRFIAGLFLYHANVTNQSFTEHNDKLELDYIFTETSYGVLKALLPVFTKYIAKLEEFYKSMDVECNFWDMWYLNMVRVVTDRIPKTLQGTTDPKTVATLAILAECFHTKSLYPILSHHDPLAHYPREFLHSEPRTKNIKPPQEIKDLTDLKNTHKYLLYLKKQYNKGRRIDSNIFNKINNKILMQLQGGEFKNSLNRLELNKIYYSDSTSQDALEDEVLFNSYSSKIEHLIEVCELLLVNKIQPAGENIHQPIPAK